MKLGILLCDHVQPALQEEFADLDHMFTQLLSQCDSTIELHYYWVVDGEFPDNIDVCDAYMTSGSKASVNDDLPWITRLERFVWQLFVGGKPFVGICFGHQLIAKILGGKVAYSAKGWGVGVATTKVHCHKPWMQPHKKQIKLVVSHQEQVEQLPADAEVLMANDFCPYAMIQVGNNFIGLQGHPEFSRAYAKAIMQNRKTIIAEKNFTQGLQSLSQQGDGELVMRWLINFIQQVIAR
ncbi:MULTISPECIES: glutamine amidotransferase-related protein [Colwellia]|uniref:GMP synthase n=1 Tax=Colwellia marinimaniae TaxID=1513592 RepID=A0ABQ0MUL2_9GAMM|nr:MULTISPECIES: glutamine amidotransferase [Colwellia]GAW95321.1 GMP synthase [Colwellia marinimaniae]